MFCNKCGNQVPDGIKFCNNCGNPLAPVQPQQPTYDTYQQPTYDTYQQPTYDTYQPPVAPMAQPEPPKKKNTGLIIGIVSAILIFIVAGVLVWGFAFDGFGLKDKDDDKDEEKDSTSTSAVAESTTNSTSNNVQTPVTPTTPDLDLADAENTALDYLKKMDSHNFKAYLSYEILEWEDFLYASEEALYSWYTVEIDPSATRADMFADTADGFGVPIDDIEDYLKAYADDANATYGPSTFTIVSSREISDNEAATCKRATSNNIDELSQFGLNSGDYDFNDFDGYVSVDVTETFETEQYDITVTLGYKNGTWTVIHVEDSALYEHLYSLNFISYLAE